MRKFEILFDSTPARAAAAPAGSPDPSSASANSALAGGPDPSEPGLADDHPSAPNAGAPGAPDHPSAPNAGAPGAPDAAFEIYGPLGFPEPPAERPWIFSNFVQSLDGIVSFKGKDASGAAISESAEDRWLMDLLRAHADAVITGVNTLIEETENGPRKRGPVFRIMDPGLRALRRRLGRGREMNIIVTGAARLNLADYRVFDGELVDAVILTTRAGAARLHPSQGEGGLGREPMAARQTHPWVRVIACGDKEMVSLEEAMRVLRHEFNIRHLLCEGGPTLYGWLSRAGLVDEKFVTVSPVEVGQFVPPGQELDESEPEIRLPRAAEMKTRPTTFFAPGFTRETAPHWEWISCRRVGEHQFSRYRRRR